jgi:hypothetical protein
MFYGCKAAEFILEISQGDGFTDFLDKLNTDDTYEEIVARETWTDISFISKKLPDGKMGFLLILGRVTPVAPEEWNHHTHFSIACRCLALVNDYRMAHGREPLRLSHQWCNAADRHCEKIINREIEIEVRSLQKKFNKLLPTDHVSCGICLIRVCGDPLRELVLMWTADERTRKKLLSGIGFFGFGLKETPLPHNRICAVRVWGNKEKVKVDHSTHQIRSGHTAWQYIPFSSDDEN